MNEQVSESTHCRLLVIVIAAAVVVVAATLDGCSASFVSSGKRVSSLAQRW